MAWLKTHIREPPSRTFCSQKYINVQKDKPIKLSWKFRMSVTFVHPVDDVDPVGKICSMMVKSGLEQTELLQSVKESLQKMMVLYEESQGRLSCLQSTLETSGDVEGEEEKREFFQVCDQDMIQLMIRQLHGHLQYVENPQRVDASFGELVVELMSFNKELYEESFVQGHYEDRLQMDEKRIADLEVELEEAKKDAQDWRERFEENCDHWCNGRC